MDGCISNQDIILLVVWQPHNNLQLKLGKPWAQWDPLLQFEIAAIQICSQSAGVHVKIFTTITDPIHLGTNNYIHEAWNKMRKTHVFIIPCGLFRESLGRYLPIASFSGGVPASHRKSNLLASAVICRGLRNSSLELKLGGHIECRCGFESCGERPHIR